MQIKIFKTQDEIANFVSDMFIEEIKKESPVLGLATGGTPVPTYEKLIEKTKEQNISWKNVKTFNLDEYTGIGPAHSQSYRYFMNENLFNKIDINIYNTYVPNGFGNLEKNVNEYDEKIAQEGGIDLQILGIGSNGHIAFNEPGTSFDQKTHVIELTEQTREDNKRFFNSIDEVPTHSITMGLATIVKAKKIVLVATGENKADAICKMIEEQPTTDLPASILHDHANVVVVLDEASASKLSSKTIEELVEA